jgi:hypothetical protein
MRKRLLGPALVLFAIAACAGPGASSDDATARANASSPDVTDCGTFNLSQGEGLHDSAIRCFIEAVQARHRVRLKETRPTIEGDPIPVTYIADDDLRVEVTTDSRQDTFGSQIITRQTCTGPTAAPGRVSFAQCSEPISSRT